jgi:uncharacterized protein (TIGR03067 family)
LADRANPHRIFDFLWSKRVGILCEGIPGPIESLARSPCVILVLTATLACISRADDAKDDGKSIDGTWVPSAAELGGEKFPDEVRKTIKLVIGDGQYTVMVGTNPDKGNIRLDPSKNPKAMNIIGTEGPNKGKTILAIYDKTDDTLKICYDLSGRARPTEFKTTKGSQLFLVTYNRAKSR